MASTAARSWAFSSSETSGSGVSRPPRSRSADVEVMRAPEFAVLLHTKELLDLFQRRSVLLEGPGVLDPLEIAPPDVPGEFCLRIRQLEDRRGSATARCSKTPTCRRAAILRTRCARAARCCGRRSWRAGDRSARTPRRALLQAAVPSPSGTTGFRSAGLRGEASPADTPMRALRRRAIRARPSSRSCPRCRRRSSGRPARQLVRGPPARLSETSPRAWRP